MKKKPMNAILRQLPKRVDSSLIGIKTLTSVSPNARFDYIVMEKTNDKLLDLMLLLKLLERLKDGGAMAIHIAEEMPLSDYEPGGVIGDWQILYR